MDETASPPVIQCNHTFGFWDKCRATQSPLFHLLRRETREGSEWLIFDEARMQECAAQDFEGFLDWDRALLRLLAGEAI